MDKSKSAVQYYWKGSSDIIFAGTDVGVFVYNKSLNKWEEFMTNFPFITVPKLDINYCSNTLRACTSGYGIWETPLPILNANQLKPIEVASDEVWSTTRDTYRNVLVKNGATLTIQGIHDNSTNTNSVEIRIPKNNKIMVEAGGKIIISGATLTNHCDFWQGIEVYGNKSLDQTDNNQGHLIIKDGSIIENANVGIRTYKSNGSGWELTSTGGIITCFNTTFRNNQKDIEIYPYTKPSTKKTEQPVYRGNISRCNFITTDAYLTPSVNPIHISLWRINSINITGCLFEDKRAISFGSIGVNSIFSGFNINEYCVGKTQVPVASSSPCNGTATTFKTMQYAVYSIGMNNPRYSINISNTNFEHCSRSIYLNGISNASIFQNNFSIIGLSQMSTDPYISSQYGVYLDMCRAYKIEENNISGDLLSGTGYKSIGVIVRNLHGENTQIYRNNFDRLNICIEPIGQNIGADRNLGLQIKCNEFNNSECHVFVGIDPFANPNIRNIIGIAENQGLPTALNSNQLAGNIFKHTFETLYHIFNNGYHINYFHHLPSANFQFLYPFINSSNVTTINEQIEYNPITSCPSSFTNNFTSEQLRVFAINQETHLEENMLALAALLDAGNTEDFIAQLDINDASKVNSNYFLLMNVVPYISNNVIKLVIDNNSSFTNAMIRNILVVCTQAAKDPEIIDLLNQRVNPLPQYMRDQITAGLVDMSELELDLREIGTYKLNIDNSIFETIWRATQDTLDLSNDIFEIFNELENNSLKLHLVEWLDANDRFSEADYVLTNIINDLGDDEDETRNVEIFQQTRNLINSLETNNIEDSNLSAQTIIEIQSLIYEPYASTSTIFALLKLNNNLDYSEPVLFLEENENNTPLNNPESIQVSNNANLDPSEESIKINPNPGSDLIIIKYNILVQPSNLELVLTNSNGLILYTQKLNNNIDEIILNTSNYKSGNYIFTIRGNGLKTISEKVMIINK